jgi:formylglycine-generating enzyme required for sulfatase activity
MGGNVSEWTSSNFADYPGSKYKASKSDLECKVYRGGSFSTTLNSSRSTSRAWDNPTFTKKSLGFRLAATPPKK